LTIFRYKWFGFSRVYAENATLYISVGYLNYGWGKEIYEVEDLALRKLWHLPI